MMNQSLPTRAFREHTDLNQLKRQAKELLDAFRAGDGAAIAEVHSHYRAADPDTLALHDAQLVLARAYGFASWPKLKAYVDGVTVKRFLEAVRAGDSVSVKTMLRARPELVNMGVGQDEHRAIHHAVLLHSPEMTRLLMRHGADARAGIHPHRDATSAFTLASDRGYDEIVDIIRDEEQRRRETQAGTSAAAAPVLAPKYPILRCPVSRERVNQSVAMSSRFARNGMSNRMRADVASANSSLAVRRSIKSVAKPL